MKDEKYISYLRVSTKKQGESQLGLEAQRFAVLKTFGPSMEEYVEVESGRSKNRPQLKAALKRCKEEGAVLVIAKLDRLSRNLHFIVSLMESKVKFKCADQPTINNMTIQILAVVAQAEVEATSIRTKEALAALKRRGVKLGIPPISKEGRYRQDICQENALKRVYDKPDVDGVNMLKELYSSGIGPTRLVAMSERIFGRKLSRVTIYKYLKIEA